MGERRRWEGGEGRGWGEKGRAMRRVSHAISERKENGERAQKNI